MQYRFIDMDKVSPYYSVALFGSIAEQIAKNKSKETLLFWRVNKECIYLGYHQFVKSEVNEKFCKQNKISIVRRILGGGCGFCDENQILYSVIGKEGNFIPYNIQNAYKIVLNGVIFGLNDLGFNAEFIEKRNAVYCNGKKISGNAQYRNNGVAMINGSFLLDFNFEKMNKALKFPAKNLHCEKAEDGMITLKQLFKEKYKKEIMKNGKETNINRRKIKKFLKNNSENNNEIVLNINEIKEILKNGFERALGVKFRKGKLTKEEKKIVKELTEKYKTKEWIYRMDLKKRKENRK